MVPGESEISLNCYNSRNTCHSEEWLQVLAIESRSHALPGDIFSGLKLENLYTTFDILRFFTLEMIKTPFQGSVLCV